MKIFIKNTLLSIISMTLILIGIVFYLEYTEQPSTHWNNTNEMNIPDIFQYGWIPRWFPTNATNIYEQHDIDTNRVWIKFELSENENPTFIQSFNLLKPQEINNIDSKAPFLANWWFEGLIERSSSNNNALHADIYQGHGNDISKNIFLAKDKLSHTYYIWTIAH